LLEVIAAKSSDLIGTIYQSILKTKQVSP